jgi:hypothetical protein
MSDEVRPIYKGIRAVRSVFQNWEVWRDRGRLPLSFQMAQVFSRHGAFGEYLRKIGRVVTNTCHHCGEDEDTTITCRSFARGERPPAVTGD